MGTTPLGFAYSETPFLGLPAKQALPILVPDLPTAHLSTGANVVTGSAFEEIDADMMDMETYAILRSCQKFACQAAISQSRRDELMAALGMGVGGALFALLGLTTLLTAVPQLHLMLKVLGGLYLIYLAFNIWRGSTMPMKIDNGKSKVRTSNLNFFRMALGLQMSNPKTAIVYSSIFTAFLPSTPPIPLIIALVPAVFVVEFCWYAIVAMLFSQSGPRRIYLKSKTAIDQVAALVPIILGIKLLIGGTDYNCPN